VDNPRGKNPRERKKGAVPMRRITKNRKEAKKLFENVCGEEWLMKELEVYPEQYRDHFGKKVRRLKDGEIFVI